MFTPEGHARFAAAWGLTHRITKQHREEEYAELCAAREAGTVSEWLDKQDERDAALQEKIRKAHQ